MANLKNHRGHDWTSEQDDVLLQCVRDCGGNVSKGMYKAAETLGMTYYVCKNRWYNPNAELVSVYQASETYQSKSVKELVNLTPVLESKESSTSLTQALKTSMDGFLLTLKALKSRNAEMEEKIKDQDKRLESQARIMREMAHENKELQESYRYVLNVMERARKMFVEEEQAGVIKYKTDNTGNVSFKNE